MAGPSAAMEWRGSKVRAVLRDSALPGDARQPPARCPKCGAVDLGGRRAGGAVAGESVDRPAAGNGGFGAHRPGHERGPVLARETEAVVEPFGIVERERG